MTQYRLKKGVENFQVVDGSFAGRKFVRGKIYGDVPPEEKSKFEKLETKEKEKVKPEFRSQKSGVKTKTSEP